MSSTVQDLQNPRLAYAEWHQRVRIKKLDTNGQPIPGEYACGGELLRLSPRYIKNGRNFRVKPEQPAVFFANWCHEHRVLPSPLTAEECRLPEVLQLLEQLWVQYAQHFPSLQSPLAACDDSLTPNLANGFSFTIAQSLIETAGTIKATPGRNGFRATVVPHSNGQAAAISRKIEEIRAKAAAAGGRAVAEPSGPSLAPISAEVIDELRQMIATPDDTRTAKAAGKKK